MKKGSDGRKERGERMVSVKQHSDTKKKQSNIIERICGMEQGHEDMCSFDDKEIKHKSI